VSSNYMNLYINPIWENIVLQTGKGIVFILCSDKMMCLKWQVLSAHQEKIPARNAIYAHAQDLSAGDEILLAILKAFIPHPLNKQ
jgi:hypothetical protein